MRLPGWGWHFQLQSSAVQGKATKTKYTGPKVNARLKRHDIFEPLEMRTKFNEPRISGRTPHASISSNKSNPEIAASSALPMMNKLQPRSTAHFCTIGVSTSRGRLTTVTSMLPTAASPMPRLENDRFKALLIMRDDGSDIFRAVTLCPSRG